MTISRGFVLSKTNGAILGETDKSAKAAMPTAGYARDGEAPGRLGPKSGSQVDTAGHGRARWRPSHIHGNGIHTTGAASDGRDKVRRQKTSSGEVFDEFGGFRADFPVGFRGLNSQRGTIDHNIRLDPGKVGWLRPAAAVPMLWDVPTHYGRTGG